MDEDRANDLERMEGIMLTRVHHLSVDHTAYRSAPSARWHPCCCALNGAGGMRKAAVESEMELLSYHNHICTSSETSSLQEWYCALIRKIWGRHKTVQVVILRRWSDKLSETGSVLSLYHGTAQQGASQSRGSRMCFLRNLHRDNS